ncbi:MAG: hypothetical protein RIR70_1159 [Pseudomonadota bacterium]|jgi:flagellar FliL protein
MSEDAKDAAPPKKSKKLLFIILGVVVLAAAGAGFMMMKAKKDAEAKDAEGGGRSAKEMKPPVFVQMDDFLVNLPGRGGEHFLQARVVLRTSDSATEGRIKAMLPLIRDRLLTVLSQRPMEVLATVEGKSQLTVDMALVINAVLEPELTAIYALSRDPTGAELRNLERLGVMPRNLAASGGATGKAASKLVEVSEMDLPVQGVLFSSFIMQ